MPNDLTFVNGFRQFLGNWIAGQNNGFIEPRENDIVIASENQNVEMSDPRNPLVLGSEFGIDIDDYMRGANSRRMAYYDNPDVLVQQQQLQRYADMMTDAEVRSAINAKRFAVISADWDIVPAGNSAMDKEIAEFVKYNFMTCEGTISGIWFQLLKSLADGYAISEMCFEPCRTGQYSGKWRMNKVRNKNVIDYEFGLDHAGNVVDLWLGYRAPRPMQMPLWKFLIYTYQPEYDAVFGRSDLRAVHQNWWYKILLLKLAAVYAEMIAFPIRVGKYPQGQGAAKTGLFNVLKGTGGNRNTIVVPDDFDIKFENGSSQPSIDLFDKLIAYHDAQIEKGIVGQTLTSGESKVGGGSAALGTVHQDTKEDYVTFLRVDSQDFTTDKPVKRIVDINYASVDNYPRFVWVPRKNKIVIANALDLKTLIDSGLLVEDDANIIRERLDLPPNAKFQGDETLKSAAPSPGAAPAAEPTPYAHSHFKRSKKNPRQLIDSDMYACEIRLGGVSYYKKQDKKQKKYVEDYINEAQPIVEKAARGVQKIVQSQWGTGLALAGNIAWDKAVKDQLNDLTTGWINNIVNTEYRESLKEINVKSAAIPDVIDSVPPTVNVGLKFAPDVEAIENLKSWQVEKDFAAMKQYYADRLAGTISAQDARGKFWISDVIERDTLKAAQNAILETMSNGGSANDAAKAIGDAFRKYGSAPDLKTPAQLEMIARTNMTRTIVDSQLAAYTTDPTGEFPGVMISEVMDDVICEECEARDGEIYEIDDPELAAVEMPLHPNCRGRFLPASATEVAEYLGKK